MTRILAAVALLLCAAGLAAYATAKHGDQIGLRPDIAAALGIETGAGDE